MTEREPDPQSNYHAEQNPVRLKEVSYDVRLNQSTVQGATWTHAVLSYDQVF